MGVEAFAVAVVGGDLPNGCWEWPFTPAEYLNSSVDQMCNSVAHFTRNGMQNWFGDFYILLSVSIGIMFGWYTFLCVLRCCCSASVRCKDTLGCCCTRYNGHFCRSTSGAPGWEATAVVLCLLKVFALALLYYPPFWNGTTLCGLWSWELSNLLLVMLRSLFFLSLCLWMLAELNSQLPFHPCTGARNRSGGSSSSRSSRSNNNSSRAGSSRFNPVTMVASVSSPSVFASPGLLQHRRSSRARHSPSAGSVSVSSDKKSAERAESARSIQLERSVSGPGLAEQDDSSSAVDSTALLGKRGNIEYHAIIPEPAPAPAPAPSPSPMYTGLGLPNDASVSLTTQTHPYRSDPVHNLVAVRDKSACAALVSVGMLVVFVLLAGVFAIGYFHDSCHADIKHVHTQFSFNDPCQFIGVSQLFLKTLIAILLFSLGRRCEIDHLPQRLGPLARTIMVFGLAEFGWVAADAVFMVLDLVWTYEFEVALHLVLVTAPVLQFLVRTLFKCSNPAVVIQSRLHTGREQSHSCSCNRYRMRQCCQSLQYTVPLVFIVTFFSAALASISGIATCYVPVLNTTVPGNYTPNQAAFGVGLFWARAGAGPLGFLVFATSVCVYFGVTAVMEKGLSGLPLPRVTGSPIAAHSMLAIVLLVFLGIHIWGHLVAKVAFDDMTIEERSQVGAQFYKFFNGFVHNWWPMPYSYMSGFLATFLLVILSVGGVLSVSHGGIYPWCCFKRLSCRGCCRCCGIYEAPFRSVHRIAALLVPPALFFHSVEESLGAWLIWTWMLLLLLFAVAEYVGFQGWCTYRACCFACRPESLKLCSMRHEAVILSVQHEMCQDKLAPANRNWMTKPNVIVTFRCRHPGFLPKVGEFCFVGIADEGESRARQVLVGNSFHPFTLFPLAEEGVFGLYLHTGLDERTEQCRPERGGWCFKHFAEGTAGERFSSPEECHQRALQLLRGKAVYVVGGFPSELAKPSFTRATKIFCTCAGAGATPFMALAGDCFRHPERYNGKIITVVRGGRHPAVPEYLKQFGFRAVSLEDYYDPRGVENEDEEARAGIPARNGPQTSVAKRLGVVARLSQAVGGVNVMRMSLKHTGIDFTFIQGYVNIESVLSTAIRKQVACVRAILKSRHPRGAAAYDTWEASLPRPLLELDAETLASLLDGWQLVDVNAIIERLRKAQIRAWKASIQRVVSRAGIELDGQGLEAVDSSRKVDEFLATVLGGQLAEANMDVADVLEQAHSAQEAAVEEVLRHACRGDSEAFHPWRGLREPLLGLTEDSQLASEFGSDAYELIESISEARRRVVETLFSSVYVGHTDFASWFRVQALGEFPNVYKLDAMSRDQLCPIVKLAKTFADGGQDGESVSFGHCGHGERIDYDSNAFQTHRSTGEAFVETFD